MNFKFFYLSLTVSLIVEIVLGDQFFNRTYFILFRLVEILYSKCVKYICDCGYDIYIPYFVHIETETLYVCHFFSLKVSS